jgi:hypothetical protein
MITFELEVRNGLFMRNFFLEFEGFDFSIALDDVPTGFGMDTLGRRSYVGFQGESGNYITHYKHNNPKNVTNISAEQYVDADLEFQGDDITEQDVKPGGMFVRDDGYLVVVCNQRPATQIRGIHMYDQWDLTSFNKEIVGYNHNEYSSQLNVPYTPKDVHLNDIGTKMIVLDTDYNLREYTLSNPWDVNSASQINSINLSAYLPTCFTMSLDGKAILISGDRVVRQVSLDLPFDLSNYSVGNSIETIAENTAGVCVDEDLENLFFISVPSDTSTSPTMIHYKRGII